MPNISSIQTKATDESASTPQVYSREDALAFAKMLAASVQDQAQSSLSALASPATKPTFSPTESRFAQLAFLSQPANLMLPSFIANRWPSSRKIATDSIAAAPPPPAGVQRRIGSTGADAVAQPSKVGATGHVQKSSRPIDLSAFPRPANDNGRGIHWIPTLRQSPDVIDKYVDEAQKMVIKWVTLLNDGTKQGDNDYLVDRLTAAGIEPVMRLYTDGGSPLQGDVQSLVRHYSDKGVHYFQLYNEPNLRIENQGKAPDPKAYAARWLADARKVIAGGGLPGLGALSPTPGLAPGAAPGDMDDLRFLRQSLQEVVRLGGQDVLDKTWLSVHNYGQAHLRVRDYNKVVQEVLGRSMPEVGTEAGIYPGDTLS